MGQQGGELTPRYTVLINKRARKGLPVLSGNRRREAEKFLNEMLSATPLVRVPGKTKKLRGEYEKLGYLQFDPPDGYRIQYRVDQGALTVYVEYIGPHP